MIFIENFQKSKQNSDNDATEYKFVSSEINEDFDDEKLIAEAINSKQASSNLIANTRNLFIIESKYLNADNEVNISNMNYFIQYALVFNYLR